MFCTYPSVHRAGGRANQSKRKQKNVLDVVMGQVIHTSLETTKMKSEVGQIRGFPRSMRPRTTFRRDSQKGRPGGEEVHEGVYMLVVEVGADGNLTYDDTLIQNNHALEEASSVQS
jgi:hypothetical protein